MALSYFTESEAPRDFRISSTESESYYTKCLLCYTIRKNFYCVACIRAGNFVHSSMPYSDRYAERQAKLLRMKANRKHVQDRCETLLASKGRLSNLQTELKQCKDRVELLKLAIEQRKGNIVDRKQELVALIQYNNEVTVKLPRYEKRVGSLAKHSEQQLSELQRRAEQCGERAERLAALRRARIRQLTKYIFPVYTTYDSSDSLEDMEFLRVEESTEGSGGEMGRVGEEGEGGRERLHVVAAWLPADGDAAVLRQAVSLEPEGGAGAGAGAGAGPGSGACAGAALALGAQLVALLAWLLDVRLPYVNELNPGPLTASSAEGRFRSLCASCVALSGRAAPLPPRAALRLLLQLLLDASLDDPALGRVNPAIPAEVSGAAEAWSARWPPPPPPPPALAGDPPEHLSWPQPATLEELGGTPPPPASLVTSAAASIASIWRGWTKN